MSLTTTYLVTTKNLGPFLEAVRGAKAPERFNVKFLTHLGFTSSNDRLFIALFKTLRLVDESGIPTRRYYSFLDQEESPRILAESVRDAYEDLFAVDKKANELAVDKIKNKLKTLTQGQKSDHVLSLMASTFKALCALADWKTPQIEKSVPVEEAAAQTAIEIEKHPTTKAKTPGRTGLSLHYDIHVHLPESRDPAVFDAIFEAMNKHLAE